MEFATMELDDDAKITARVRRFQCTCTLCKTSFLIVVYEPDWAQEWLDEAKSVKDLSSQQYDELRTSLLTAIFTSTHFTANSQQGVHHRLGQRIAAGRIVERPGFHAAAGQRRAGYL